MKCKCGSDMRAQTQGVWFCVRGDYFAVAILGSKDVDYVTVQWYKKGVELEYYEKNAFYQESYRSQATSTRLRTIPN